MFKFSLHENEKLEAMIRQTEMVLLKPALWVLVLIYAPWYFLIKYELVEDYHRLLLAWTILVFLYAVYKYLLWLLNVYLLTDKRLVAINYASLARKKISDCPLDRIANIGISTTGFLSSLLGYGDVEVQVMHSIEPVILKNIRQPAAVKDIIWRIHGRNTPAAVENMTYRSGSQNAVSRLKPEQKRKVV